MNVLSSDTIMSAVLAKARTCATYADLTALFEENGIWLNDAALQSVWSSLHREETLSLSELEGVAGGLGCDAGETCPTDDKDAQILKTLFGMASEYTALL